MLRFCHRIFNYFRWFKKYQHLRKIYHQAINDGISYKLENHYLLNKVVEVEKGVKNLLGAMVLVTDGNKIVVNQEILELFNSGKILTSMEVNENADIIIGISRTEP